MLIKLGFDSVSAGSCSSILVGGYCEGGAALLVLIGALLPLPPA